MLHFSAEPAACRVVGLWLFAPGAIAAPFIFWRSFAAGACFLIGWVIFSLCLVPLHTRSLHGNITLGELRIEGGLLFKFRRRVPTRSITGFSRLGTPLLHWCGCCVMVLYTSGCRILLPGLSDETADALQNALEVARL